VGELFERFLRDGAKLDVTTRSDFLPPGTPIFGKAGPEEAFEWQALLDAIADADRRLTMLELGAGFGRWTVSAAAAIRRYRPELRYRLVALEAEPTHFRWLSQHTRDNGVRRWSRTGSCKLVNAAVSSRDGYERFTIGNPREWYGQALVQPQNAIVPAQVARVQTVRLSRLLRPLDRVDLIDLDIQGVELEVLAEAAPSLGRVRRIHVETHSDVIDRELPAVFERAAGEWRLEVGIPLGARGSTPLGEADFSGGGVQLWRNVG
jgi:FkbM family methyltransferase